MAKDNIIVDQTNINNFVLSTLFDIWNVNIYIFVIVVGWHILITESTFMHTARKNIFLMGGNYHCDKGCYIPNVYLQNVTITWKILSKP